MNQWQIVKWIERAWSMARYPALSRSVRSEKAVGSITVFRYLFRTGNPACNIEPAWAHGNPHNLSTYEGAPSHQRSCQVHHPGFAITMVEDRCQRRARAGCKAEDCEYHRGRARWALRMRARLSVQRAQYSFLPTSEQLPKRDVINRH